LKIFKKPGLLEKKEPKTKITKVAWIIFAETSPRAVQTHLLTPYFIEYEMITILGVPGVIKRNKIIWRKRK
tara:strand:+ start:70 stop:282 length:213 start_codon:yes stop_codon:yes gene_type:complete